MSPVMQIGVIGYLLPSTEMLHFENLLQLCFPVTKENPLYEACYQVYPCRYGT